MKTLRRTALLTLATATLAGFGGQAFAEGQSVAPAGACAEPRSLARAADPGDFFDIAGPPATRLVPAQVAAKMPIPGTGAGPLPAPPPGPSISLCDSPNGCGQAAAPSFVESPPAPSLPPGLP